MSNESRIASTERALSESHVYMSKADMVTGALRELVLGGELEPGEPLPQ
jgi:DNA-binding GntR family transcriptional regulator